MEHAHTNQDAVLAAFLEQGALPDIAKRVNMSLAALATWASDHADLLAKVHALLVTRCKLIAAQLELAALSALSAVSSSTTNTDDPKLRERALERQRKAANAILRHNTSLQRTPSASSGPQAPPQSHAPAALPNAESRMPNAAVSPKPSLAHRLAARRLAALAT